MGRSVSRRPPLQPFFTPGVSAEEGRTRASTSYYRISVNLNCSLPVSARLLVPLILPSSRQGDILFEAGEFAAAKAAYFREAHKTIGPGVNIPATPGAGDGGVRRDVYSKMDPFKRTNMVGCCLGMAKSCRQENYMEMASRGLIFLCFILLNTLQALAWCEEITSLHRCGYYSKERDHPLHDWHDHILDIPELSFLTASGLCLASDIFAALGNSATAATRRWVAGTMTINLGDTHRTPALKAVLNMRLTVKLLECRHPDPRPAAIPKVTVSALQARGSWARLHVARPGGFTEGRQDFASFLWNSHIYIAGGRKAAAGPYYRDIWKLDLTKLDEWRQLPDYPVPFAVSGIFLGWNILVYNDTAILFTGRPTVDVFDLKTETWGSFSTTYTPTPGDIAAGVVDGWPYPGRIANDFSVQILGNKLYVFGGGHYTTRMGCNLFMELDLVTHKWRRISGTVRVTEHADHSCPGPRKTAASWVSTDKTRIFLLFGILDRAEAKADEPHKADEAFGCSDFWSWNVKDEVWRRERLSGNPPCARTEMACAYNEKLQKTIIFGGYSPNLPTHIQKDGRSQTFPYSYFADTFFYDMAPDADADFAEPTRSASKWKQVLTPGFPTYRCQAHLACDPATGRTYMFGGWTNSQYIPTRSKLMARTFGDLWELRVDVPSGHFEEVDVAEEARVAQAGPWQRCFACAAAGPWRKCGGSCKGRVFFCGNSCLRDGWKEHKEMHQCRKA
ncbi:hypothetical protein B0H19DRAFT_1210061 [Mycena capillaripes]|nr:hypothetical protein B0H19DRAFT_1210061 [Mycena capillaripes]